MKDSRKGEALWSEWDGYGQNYHYGDSSLIFFTEEHVDVNNEIVKRALASTLQRDGIIHSLAQGFQLIDSGRIDQGYAGSVGGDIHWTFCNEDGETDEGDAVATIHPITYVEVQIP